MDPPGGPITGAPGGPITGAQPVPSHWRNSTQSGPISLAGDITIPTDPAALLLEDYRRHMADERGLSTSTIRNYGDVARSFLLYVSRDQPVDMENLSGGLLTEFVMAETRRGKVSSAKAMTTRLRCFLRFLHVGGLTPFSLVGAVPSVAGWRGRRSPRR